MTNKLNTDQLVEEVLVAMENIPQEEGEDSNYLRQIQIILDMC